MKKSNLSAHVTVQASLFKAVANSLVDAVFSTIGDAIARAEGPRHRRIWYIHEQKQPSPKTRNPRAAESITIPASKLPSFKACRTLHEEVNNCLCESKLPVDTNIVAFLNASSPAIEASLFATKCS